MANNTFRAKVLEDDPKVIAAICNALNALANPKSRMGFKIQTSDEQLVFSVLKNKNSVPVFEVAFNVSSSSDEIIVKAINTLFKKCILSFGYDDSTKELVVSIVENYTFKPEAVNFDQTPGLEKNCCMLTLSRSIPMLEQVVEVLNVVKIKKFLTMARNSLTVSAIGDHIAITLRLNVVDSHTSALPFFFTKFNYVSAQGLADYNFALIKFDVDTPDLFQISVFTPQDEARREKFEKTMELIDSTSIFSNQ